GHLSPVHIARGSFEGDSSYSRPNCQCTNLWLDLSPGNRDSDGADCLLCVVFLCQVAFECGLPALDGAVRIRWHWTPQDSRPGIQKKWVYHKRFSVVPFGHAQCLAKNPHCKHQASPVGDEGHGRNRNINAIVTVVKASGAPGRSSVFRAHGE